MEIDLLNTAQGLVPIYDSDFEKKKKLKIGETYRATIKQPRNYEFHKRYFALIRMGHNYLNEQQLEKYPTEESLRKAVQVMAGYCEIGWTLDGQEIIQPQSISFGSMDELEFREVYNRVLDVLLKHVFVELSKEEIDQNIKRFL